VIRVRGTLHRAALSDFRRVTPLPRPRHVFPAVVLFALFTMSASAQEPVGAFEQLRSRLPVGSAITVTDKAGGRTVGLLREISPTSIGLLVGGAHRAFAVEEVQRVQQRRADRLTNGLLIGAAAGSGYGLYWYLRDPNECGGTVCGSDLAMGAAVGAAIGLAIDAAIKENVTVYVAPGPVGAGRGKEASGGTGATILAAVKFAW
jgi:hypothetical protein